VEAEELSAVARVDDGPCAIVLGDMWADIVIYCSLTAAGTRRRYPGTVVGMGPTYGALWYTGMDGATQFGTLTNRLEGQTESVSGMK
jgi:hypothetical protein